jgi:hypothetical protein
MSGLFSSPVSSEAPKPSGIQISTSALGRPIALVFGRTRLSGNFIWIANAQSYLIGDVEKPVFGGTPSSTQEEYIVSAMVGLCEGPIRRLRLIWKASSGYILKYPNLESVLTENSIIDAFVETEAGRTDFFYARGTNEQTPYNETIGVGFALPWASVLWFPPPSLPLAYKRTAYFGKSAIFLSNQPQMPNFNFEAEGLATTDLLITPATQYTLGDVIGVDASDVILFLTGNPIYGSVPQMLQHFGSFSKYSDFVLAYDLPVNLLVDDQVTTLSIISEILEATNSDAVFTQGFLKIIPKTDSPAQYDFTPQYSNILYARSRRYVPQFFNSDGEIEVIYSLDEDDFESESFSRESSTAAEDIYNVFTMDFSDRALDYSSATVEYTDEASVATIGRRDAPSIDGKVFCDGTVARRALTLIAQQKTTQKNRYSAILGWRFVLLDPEDFVTLTHAEFEESETLVRVKSIEESEDGKLQFEFEEYHTNIGTEVVYEHQPPEFDLPDVLADPGNVQVALIFEPTYRLAQGFFSFWLMGTSSNRNWGGARVLMSEDGGETFRYIGNVRNAATQIGTVTTAYTSSTEQFSVGTRTVTRTNDPLRVTLSRPNVQLSNYSQEDAALFRNPYFLGFAGNYEIVSYETATLVSTDSSGRNTYDLSPVYRSAFGTTPAPVRVGSYFASLGFFFEAQTNILKMQVTRALTERNLQFKFLSYNIYGVNVQLESDVPTHYFRVTGDVFCKGVPAVNNFSFMFSAAAARRRELVLTWNPEDVILADEIYEIRKAPLELPSILLDIYPDLDPDDLTALWSVASPIAYTREKRAVVQGDGIYLIAIRCGDPVDATEADVAGRPSRYGPKSSVTIENSEAFIENIFVSNTEIPFSADSGSCDYESLIKSFDVFLYQRLGNFPRKFPEVYDRITQGSYPSGAYVVDGGLAEIQFRSTRAPLSLTNQYCLKVDNFSLPANGLHIELPNVEMSPSWTFVLWVSDTAQGPLFSLPGGEIFHFDDSVSGISFTDSDSVTHSTGILSGLGLPKNVPGSIPFYMFVFSYNGNTKRLEIYVSSSLVKAFENVEYTPQDGTIIIGSNSDFTDHFSGYAFGFSYHTIYNFNNLALVQSLWDAATGNFISDPKAYYSFIESYFCSIFIELAERGTLDLPEVSGNGLRGLMDPTELTLTSSLISNDDDGARIFDGVNQYMYMGWPSSTLVNEDYQSISFIFRRHREDVEDPLVYIFQDGGSKVALYVRVNASNNLAVDAYDESGTKHEFVISDVVIEADRKYHFFASHDSSWGGLFVVYLNGRRFGLYTFGFDKASELGDPDIDMLWIGRKGSNYFEGVIDEIAFHNENLELPYYNVRKLAEVALTYNGLVNLEVTPEGYVKCYPNQEGFYYPTANNTLILTSNEVISFSSDFDLIALPTSRFSELEQIQTVGQIGRTSVAEFVEGEPQVRAASTFFSGDLYFNPATGFFIYGDSFDEGFQVGDSIEVSGFDAFELNGTFTIAGFSGDRGIIYIEETIPYGAASSRGQGLLAKWNPWSSMASPVALLGIAFQVRFRLQSKRANIFAILSKFRWTADVPDVTRTGTVTTIAATGAYVTVAYGTGFTFNSNPKIVVSVQDANVGDRAQVANVTESSFDVRVLDVFGSYVSRDVEWFARGY